VRVNESRERIREGDIVQGGWHVSPGCARRDNRFVARDEREGRVAASATAVIKETERDLASRTKIGANHIANQ
jgi:hypothetical protein